MKELTFIPFGAQYYRAPTPLEEDWLRDLTSFRDHGFNTVKLWAQWGWNMPKEEQFDFSDLDRLMDICRDLGLRVVINIIYDVAPHWFNKKYPESFMITSSGRILRPQSISCRQIGGAPGPCLHHPQGIECRRRFTEAVAQRYADHLAMFCWDLWNEPELTCGVAREPIQDHMVCYCEHSVRAFREWLKKQYGTLEALCKCWGRRYGDWEEVEPPRDGRTYRDMIDWRAFFAETLAEEVHMRAEAVRKFDRTHSVMVHEVPEFDFVNTCSESYLLAKEMDWFGNSNGSNPFSAACSVGAAKGKWVLNAEIHAIGGTTFSHPAIPSLRDIKRHIFVPFGQGIKGFLFWQYRPERLGWEAPAWGLTAMDGGETPWLGYAAKVNRALQNHTDRLLKALPKAPAIAVVRSKADEVFLWAVESSERLYHQSVEGAFRALYNADLPVTVISENQLIEEDLSGYRAIYYPLPYYVDSRAAEKVRRYVADGGTLVSEALFGAFNSENNLHHTVLPGYGFETVFGCREASTVSASVFRNAYEGNWADQIDADMIAFANDQGEKCLGYHYRQSFVAESATVLARYENGDAAVTCHAFGKGKAVLIGSCPGIAFHRTGDPDTGRFIADLVSRTAGIEPIADMKNGGRCDILYTNQRPQAVILQWLSEQNRAICFRDPLLFGKKLVNPIDDSCLKVEENGHCVVPDEADTIDLYLVEEE